MKLILTIIAVVFIIDFLVVYGCIKAAGDYTRDEEREDSEDGK